jgi:hypothetical protein
VVMRVLSFEKLAGEVEAEKVLQAAKTENMLCLKLVHDLICIPKFACAERISRMLISTSAA